MNDNNNRPTWRPFTEYIERWGERRRAEGEGRRRTLQIKHIGISADKTKQANNCRSKRRHEAAIVVTVDVSAHDRPHAIFVFWKTASVGSAATLQQPIDAIAGCNNRQTSAG